MNDMNPHVCVLMCTYNGENYIRKQLESLKAQKGVQVSFFIHDDGSSDETLDILGEYGITPVYDGHLGPARGFLYLLEHAPAADLYAFCDQDDVWDPDKLYSAADMITKLNDPERPALYCCSTRLISESGAYIEDHILDSRRTPASRLFYASVSGNTIVFNPAMRSLTLKALPDRLVMHDSWMVKLCIAAGGQFLIDEKPHMDYRMHSGNQIGMETTFSQKLQKLKKVTGNDGEDQELLDMCVLYGDQILPEYRNLAKLIEEARGSVSARRKLLRQGGVDFNSFAFNLAFRLKVLRGNI